MNQYKKVRVVIERDGDSYFAYCPHLNGVLVQGNSLEEAENFIKETLIVHIYSMLNNNEPLPDILVSEQDPISHPKQTQREPKFIPISEVITEDLEMSFA